MRQWLSATYLAPLLLSGCMLVGPDYETPSFTAPAGWYTAREEAGLQTSRPADLALWWHTFDDALLNQLIDQAIANNLDLRAAATRVRRARAQRGIESAGLFPSINTNAGARRRGTSDNSEFPTDTNTLYSASFDSRWEIDIFGGTRRAVEAATADIQAQEAELNDTLVSVLAEVALNYIELRTFQARLITTQANLKAQEETLDLVRSRMEVRFSTELEVDQAQTNVSATQAQIPTLQTRLVAAKNRITTLLALPPGALDKDLNRIAAIPKAPHEIAVGVPADVLRRRPDIRQAERVLAAETARIGAAIADLYPKLSLAGSIGLESLDTGNLFSSASQAFAVIPSISWPLFNAGRIRNNIAAQEARQEQAVIAYEQAVLLALEEVENSLTAYANELIRNRVIRQGAAASARASSIARERYNGGLSSFIDVLDAQRSQLTTQDAVDDSDAQIVANLVRIYKALGGGWNSLATTGSGASSNGQ